MSYLYNNKKESSRQDNPQFLPGMNCANFTSPVFEFERADVSLLTDMDGFFSNCSNLLVTPIMSDLNGKNGLDTMLSGCLDLLGVRLEVPINESITIYTVPRGSEIPATTFGQILLQNSATPSSLYYLDFEHPEKIKTLTLSNEMYADLANMNFWKDGSGYWQPYNVGGEPSTFETILNQNGWQLASIGG